MSPPLLVPSARRAHVVLQRPAEIVRAPLLGQELRLDEPPRLDVAVVQAARVEREPSVLTLLERRDGDAITEEVRARLDDLREGAPGARARRRLDPEPPELRAGLVHPAGVAGEDLLERVVQPHVRDA